MISSINLNVSGKLKPYEKINQLSSLIEGWDPPKEKTPSLALLGTIASLVEGNEDALSGRSELDSHDNMVVLDKDCRIISRSNRSVDVNAFDNDVGLLKIVPIVDTLVAYDCKRTLKSYLLVVKNELFIKSMLHNLIPPFIIRQMGLIVNDVCKIHLKSVGEYRHTIQNPETDLVIQLYLEVIFSVFDTRIPNNSDFENYTDPVVITPEGRTWNPYCESFAKNEDAFTDYGDILFPSEYIYQELIDDEDLNHDTLDWLDVGVVLVACEDLNQPLKLFTVEREVASTMADSLMIHEDMRNCPDQLKMRL